MIYMNILLISGDNSLLETNKETPNNTKYRMNLLSKDVSNLYIAVLTEENDKKKIIKLSNNLYIYSIPCKSKNPLKSIIKGYKICSKICSDNHIHVMSVQEPFIMGFIGYLLKLMYKIPFNIQLHGDFIDNSWWIKQSKTRFFWNKWAKFVLKKADTIRTVNPKIKKQLVGNGIKEKKIMDFPVFLDVNKFENCKKDLKDKFSNFDNIILFVGFLIPRKGVDVLINAFSLILEKFPNTLLLLVGDGPERTKLENLSEKLNLSKNIIFEGNISHEDICAYFKLCNLFVLPSFSESWGRVVLEAMVFEKPVIVSNACKIADLIQKSNSGLIFNVNDPFSLSEKILYILENEKSLEMGIQGKKIVKNEYSELAIVPKYKKLWEKTLKEVSN